MLTFTRKWAMKPAYLHLLPASCPLWLQRKLEGKPQLTGNVVVKAELKSDDVFMQDYCVGQAHVGQIW